MTPPVVIRPFEHGFGAELTLDLRAERTGADDAVLRDALASYGLLLVRQPGLTNDDLTRFASVFGPLLRVGTGDRLEQYVSNVRADGTLGSAELVWHSDTSFAPEPYQVLSLFAVDVVAGASSTRFVSGVNTARSLPKTLRAEVVHRQAVHVAEVPASVPRGQRLRTLGPSVAACAHPILKRHPMTDREILYVNLLATDCIFGLTPERSDGLLTELFDELYAPDRVYEHFWQNGDLIVWDNLAMQHSRGDVGDVGNRTLQKFTIGRVSLVEQFPDLLSALSEPYQTAAAK
jgi:taurine dioxygenase